jgi:hypothetical protein
MWGVCFQCSDYDDEVAFKRQCKALWGRRRTLMHGRRDRARTINFANVQEKLAECFPGASKTQIRALAIMRTKAIAAAFMKAFVEMNAFEKECVRRINEEYLNELNKAAADPTYAATPHGHTLSSEEASYLTVIASGITESFVCRMPNCHFFGCNDPLTWIKEFEHYHFKCPACGEFYRPWADYKGSKGFQYVIGITDPENGQHRFIPAIWPSSEEAGWLAKMVELHASQIKTEQDLEAWNNKAKRDLAQLITQQALPVFFTKHPWRQEVEWRMSNKWDWEPIKKQGYFTGAFLTAEQADQTPYSNWTELIGLIANAVASSRALVNSSRL